MFTKIKINLIDIPAGRLREVDDDWAECLSAMIAEVGQKTPIEVNENVGRFQLVAGAHRVAAAKLLKWNEIDARLLEPQTDQPAEELRLHEILENLGRKDFGALERCEALYELKRIYEALYPEAKRRGGRRGNQHTGGQKCQTEIFSFCQNAAETTGLTDRAIRMAVQIFEGLSPETRERVKGTDFAEKQSDLKALAALDHETQAKVLDLTGGDTPQAKTIADALLLLNGQKPAPEAKRILKTVSDSLVKLSKASRNTIWRNHKAEIVALAKRENWFDA